MDLPQNRFKAAIRAGRQQIGMWCTINDSTVAEMLAGCGFDWMMFDTEHAALDPISLVPLLQAVAAYPVHPVVRPGSLNPAEIKKLLDCGAQSILVPYIQSVEEARLAAAAVAYPPEGIRGVAGITRASRFGAIPGYHRRAREEICLILQIETLSALEHLEEIAAVPGVDAIFVGPSDIAAALGYPGEPGRAEVQQACLDAVRRGVAAGVPVGFLSPDQDFVGRVIEAGAVFTAVDVDMNVLRKGAMERAKTWRERVG